MESDALLALLGDGSADEPEDFEIYEDNREALEAFLCCCMQWRVLPSGKYLSLDYAALGASMVMLNVENTRAVFLGVRVMEKAALYELNRGN